MFELTMFPASDGDCLLLSYGEADEIRHVVVDGGRAGAYAYLKPALARIEQRKQRVELLVLSHIDADHIEGFLSLASDDPMPAKISAIWYNGFDQLSLLQPLGPKQGDRFSAAIKKHRWKLNAAFSRGTVVLPDSAAPFVIDLPGDLKITLLSPDSGRLATLRKEWDKWRTEQAAKAAVQMRTSAGGVQAMGGRRPFPRVLDVDALASASETIDDEAPNGSSIAFVAEWRHKRVLLGADAHPDLLAQSVAPLAAKEGGRYRIDLYKVSHHGSAKNTTRNLIGLLDCKRFAISTSGSRHGHPDAEAIAKLIKFSPAGMKTIYFNYRQDHTSPWNDAKLQTKYCYECIFPSGQNGSFSILI